MQYRPARAAHGGGPMLKRLQADFQLTIVLLFGFFSSALITPFAVYRFLTGNVVVGVLDSVLVAVIAGVVVYGWKSGRTERTGRFLVVISGLGAMMSSELLGVVGVFWMYVAIVANFFLTTNLRFAAAFTLLIIALLAVTGHSFDTLAQMWSFLATSLLLALLSYIIADQYAMQHARLKHLATVDPLTGAFNRRNMELELGLAVEEFARTRAPMALMLMDIDHFKRINDRHGHDAGDGVLCGFARVVRDNSRHIDRFYRYGGEEFLMLLKGAGAQEAGELAEKIRRACERELRDPAEAVTVSLGVAGLRPGESCQQWLARADAALYRAKHDGRNRTVLAD